MTWEELNELIIESTYNHPQNQYMDRNHWFIGVWERLVETCEYDYITNNKDPWYSNIREIYQKHHDSILHYDIETIKTLISL